ncbi:hypothetical protein [Clostridium sp.]|uniref:hypothetical protein n=1 Tax=Clostridium sp. TaxID=1506 RepID=UPI003D6CFE20
MYKDKAYLTKQFGAEDVAASLIKTIFDNNAILKNSLGQKLNKRRVNIEFAKSSANSENLRILI